MEPDNIDTQQPKTKRTLVFTSIFLVFGFIAVLLTLQKLGTKQHVELQAANGSATISVLPASVTLPPDGTMQIWITADKPVAFVKTIVTFDPAKLALTDDPILSTDKLSRVILKRSKTEANTDGTFVFVVGLDPNQRTSPPTGTFQLAALTFTKKASEPNAETTVAISTSESSVVDNAAIPFTVSGVSSSVRINPLSTSQSPTGQPTPTPGKNLSDMDGNATVDIVDYTLFMQYWWETNLSKADINHDGKINAIDYTIFMNGWYEYHQ